MTFNDAIQTVARKYAEFNGWASRSEFWWWILFTALISAALGVFSIIPAGTGTVGGIFTGLWNIAILLPTLAVGVRRLRDAGFGWGHIFWLLVPFAGLIVLVVLWTRPTETAKQPARA